jgi:uncharacterized protein with HEPN domain
MQRDDRVYLEHMLDAATRAHGKVTSRSLEEWESDEDLRLAVTHLVQTIGEAARNVSDEWRSAHPEIPWREAIGMRNVIVHNYLGVDDSIVRAASQRDLPTLIEKLQAALGRS